MATQTLYFEMMPDWGAAYDVLVASGVPTTPAKWKTATISGRATSGFVKYKSIAGVVISDSHFCTPDPFVAPAPSEFGDQTVTLTVVSRTTVIHINRVFVPGSTIVTVDGLHQQLVIDYTETDPSIGQLTFTYMLEPRSLITVSYMPLGAP
jgi:hypothetical protein